MKFGSSLNTEEALALECCKDSEYGGMGRSLKKLYCGTRDNVLWKRGDEVASVRGTSPDRCIESIKVEG